MVGGLILSRRTEARVFAGASGGVLRLLWGSKGRGRGEASLKNEVTAEESFLADELMRGLLRCGLRLCVGCVLL